ncbi:hypothetical protein ACGC1H_000037 [Rhizoctonia solani]|uniref:RING-type domain-containing protein n=1 Tax=Rhizoctonia solani TaxID=456999 RepID=A0A8H3BY27_9AGAM|nr:unnamed protein product [Rhizoctonia solani]
MPTHAPENIRLPSPTPSESEIFSGDRDETLTTQQRTDNNASSPPANNSSSNETTVPPPAPAHISLDPVIIDALSALSTEVPVRTSGRRRSSNASSTSSDIPLPPRRQPRQPVQPPISTRIRRALGLATPKASLIWRLTFGTSELIVIGVLLGLSSRPGSIPPDVRPLVIGGFDMSQWQACDRPLGAWNIVWAVKAFLGFGMAGWEYMRAIRPSTDQLIAVERARLGREVRRARRNEHSLGRTGQAPNSPTGGPTSPNGPISPRSLPPQWTMGVRREDDLDMIEATMTGSARSIEIVRNMRRIRAKREYEERWYSRCSSFQVLYGLVWFVTANILIYGSLTTCRYTSPYIWWLTFSLLCLGYLVIAEMVLVALVVFVIGPLVYVAINIVLVCMGRHPIRPGVGMAQINPDVPKMPRTMVDRIPLVMYIPTTTTTEPAAPEPTHVYPPPTSKTTPAATKRRFFFFKKRAKMLEAGDKNKPDDVEAAEWEKNEYPFVKLEANRAACAICLTDFEPPRKVGEEGESAAEPLRLLACGHVFHKECIDPWLVDVSGRCPTCQRPIEEGDLDPEEGGKKNKRRWRRRR